MFSPAFKESEIDEILEVSDHIVFNSINQLNKFKDIAKAKGKSIGLRVNPECSTQEHGIYDPCAKGSRLGVTLKNFDESVLKDIDGLHFHTLCEQGSDALEVTLKAFEEKFGKYLKHKNQTNIRLVFYVS